ncbi:hypothetical protein [Acinetobacter sp. Marseille-Q1618]|uniref:hypothetical protein n=1 Tax=Acinetobacter sp. Marseille-Q1618 TaxID=2697502 RepID=UPI00156DCC4C|nr:hypothetical protein [Acinetobacter sp. Marseille-Q1618]
MKIFFNFLPGYKLGDREIYCLTALYERSSFLTYHLYMYYQYRCVEKNSVKVAQLENTFFNLSFGSYLAECIKILNANSNFLLNAQVMSASYDSDAVATSTLIDAYTKHFDIANLTTTNKTEKFIDPPMNLNQKTI